MPRSAQRVCCVCKAACSGRVCEKHASQDPERERDRWRGSAASRGYGRRHEAWRKLILHRDPLCKIAHFCGGLSPSTVADHIIQLRAGGDWSLENGQGACEPCHNWKRAMESRQGDRGVESLEALRCGPRSSPKHTPAK
jgi:5-methylcytosine-specific restriction protein A